MTTNIKNERFKLVTQAGLFLRRDGKILLQKRCNNEYCPQLYAVPGGSIEAGEPALQTAIREAKEELNINVAVEDLHFAHAIHFKSSHGQFINFFFEVHKWDGELKIMEPNKCCEIKWFPVDALPEDITAENRQAIELSNKGIFYSERGW